MYCTRCGNQNLDTAQFCTACGKPTSDHTPKGATRFTLHRIVKIITSLQLSIIVLFAILFFGVDEQLGKTVTNLILGIQLSISVLGLLGGGIAGIVLLIQANSEQEPERSRQKQHGLAALVGPIYWIVSVILTYIITNVIANL